MIGPFTKLAIAKYYPIDPPTWPFPIAAIISTTLHRSSRAISSKVVSLSSMSIFFGEDSLQYIQ